MKYGQRCIKGQNSHSKHILNDVQTWIAWATSIRMLPQLSHRSVPVGWWLLGPSSNQTWRHGKFPVIFHESLLLGHLQMKDLPLLHLITGGYSHSWLDIPIP